MWRARKAPSSPTSTRTICRSPSAQPAREGNGRGDQGRDQGPGRDPDIPEQPARFRHRHAEPAPIGRLRVLHPVRPDPVDPGARGLDQRRRLRLQGLRPGLAGHGRRARHLVRGEIGKRGLYAFDKMYDNGYRQITSVDQADQDAGGPERLQDPRAGQRRCGPACSRRSAPRRPRSTSTRSIRRCRPRWSTARRTRWP